MTLKPRHTPGAFFSVLSNKTPPRGVRLQAGAWPASEDSCGRVEKQMHFRGERPQFVYPPDADAPHPFALLCPRRDRPCGSRADRTRAGFSVNDTELTPPTPICPKRSRQE